MVGMDSLMSHFLPKWLVTHPVLPAVMFFSTLGSVQIKKGHPLHILKMSHHGRIRLWSVSRHFQVPRNLCSQGSTVMKFRSTAVGEGAEAGAQSRGVSPLRYVICSLECNRFRASPFANVPSLGFS